MVKHKSKHSCVSAIFYDLGPKMVTKNCHFNYYFNKAVPLVIVEGGNKLPLANFHSATPKMVDYPNNPLLNIHMQLFLEISSVTVTQIWNMQMYSAS